MKRIPFEPGKNYKVVVSYPARHCLTNRGKQIQWSSGFTGVVQGEFSHYYSTKKEDYNPDLLMYSGVPVREEWDYWNNDELNPEIHRFWEWVVVKDNKGVPISLPLDFITSVMEEQPWKTVFQRTTDDSEP
jgi:hypothetical protein